MMTRGRKSPLFNGWFNYVCCLLSSLYLAQTRDWSQFQISHHWGTLDLVRLALTSGRFQTMCYMEFRRQKRAKEYSEYRVIFPLLEWVFVKRSDLQSVLLTLFGESRSPARMIVDFSRATDYSDCYGHVRQLNSHSHMAGFFYLNCRESAPLA